MITKSVCRQALFRWLSRIIWFVVKVERTQALRLSVALGVLGVVCLSMSAKAAVDDDWKACLGPGTTPDQSIAGCTSIIESGRETAANLAIAYNNRGVTYREIGELDRAIHDYDQAIRLKPDFAKAYANRGNAYSEKGQHDRAIRDYDQAIRFDPNNAVAYHGRGIAYGNKGQYDRAIQDYDQAIRLKPDFAEAYYQRGYAYSFKGQYDRAIRDFDQAIRLKPDYAEVYSDRGYAYSQKGQRDRAIQDYDQAIRLDPNNAVAYNNRCWERAVWNHDLELAIADCNKALTIEPNDSILLESRGFTYFRMGQFSKARADYESALAIQPGSASALFMRGIIKRRMGENAGADADIAAAIAIDPKVASEYAGYGVGNVAAPFISNADKHTPGASDDEREGGTLAVSDTEYLQRQFGPIVFHPVLGWVGLTLALLVLVVALRRARSLASWLGALFIATVLSTPFVWQNQQPIAGWLSKVTPAFVGETSQQQLAATMPTMLDVNECVRNANPGNMGKEFLWRLFSTCAKDLAVPVSAEGNVAISNPNPSSDLTVQLLNQDLVVVEFDASLESYDEFGARAVVANWRRSSVKEVGDLYPTSVLVGSSEYRLVSATMSVPRASGGSRPHRKFTKEQGCGEAQTSAPRNCWRLALHSLKGFLIGDWPRARARYSGWTSSAWARLQECITEHSWAVHWVVGSNRRAEFKCAEALSGEVPSEAHPDVSRYEMKTYFEESPTRACWQSPCPEYRADYSLSRVRLEGSINSKTVKYLITGVDLDVIIRDIEGQPRKALSISVSPLWLETWAEIPGVNLGSDAFRDADWQFYSEMHKHSMDGTFMNRSRQRSWWCGDPRSEGKYCWEIVVRQARGVPYSSGK